MWTGPQDVPWNGPYDQWVFRYRGPEGAFPTVVLALTSSVSRGPRRPWHFFYHKPYLFLYAVCGSASARDRLDRRLKAALRVACEEGLLVPWRTPMDEGKKARLLRYHGGPRGLALYRAFRDLDSLLIVESFLKRRAKPLDAAEVMEQTLRLESLLRSGLSAAAAKAWFGRHAAPLASLARRLRPRFSGEGEVLLREAYLLSHLSSCGLPEADETRAIRRLLTKPYGRKDIDLSHYRILH